MTEDVVVVNGSRERSPIVRGFLKHPLFWATIIGMSVRIILGILLTYNFDVTHWAQVIENIRSGNGLYELDGYYYTPPWGYMLAFMYSVWDFIGIGDFGARILDALSVEQYTDWHITATLTTISFNMLVKIPLFLCDIAVAYVIRWIVLQRTNDKKKANYAYILWFLCPLVIVISSVNGMFDTFSVLMVLLCVVFLMKDKCFMAGTMFGLAALTKFFPIFFVFILVAYIMARHKEDGTAFRKLGMAMFGAFLISLIILLPNIIEGTVADAFSFLINRADSGLGAGLGAIETYGTMLVYVIFIIISILISVRLYRGRKENESLDHRFMFFLFLNTAVLFLYPSTPQYVLLLLPFLIYAAITVDRRFRWPFVLLSIGSTIFALSCNFMLLLSAGAFTDITTVDALIPLIDMFQQPILFGMNGMDILYYFGGILQYLATVYIFYLLYKIRKEKQSGGQSKSHSHRIAEP